MSEEEKLTLKCEACGKYFEGKRSDQRFCSVSCRNRARYRSQHPEKDQPPMGDYGLVCSREDCRMYCEKIKNHCDGLTMVYIAEECPFFKTNEQYLKEHKEIVKRLKYKE